MMDRKLFRLLSVFLLALAMVILVSGCANQETGSPEQESAFQEIQAEEVKAMIAGKEDIVLLDIREQSDFEQGHLNGSISIPIGQITSRINELDKNKTIVVICYTGASSAQVAGYLVENGFAKVKNLLGGMMSWPSPELVIK